MLVQFNFLERFKMTTRKYESVTDDTIAINGATLTRIRAVIDIPGVCEVGDLGGYLQSEANLSHAGNCWVSGNAQIFDNAGISGNAQVSGNAKVYGNAYVSGNALILDNVQVSGNAYVSGDAQVDGVADISQRHQVVWFSNVGTENGTLTVYKTKDGVQVTRGCFTGTPEKFLKASQENHGKETHEEYKLLLTMGAKRVLRDSVET